MKLLSEDSFYRIAAYLDDASSSINISAAPSTAPSTNSEANTASSKVTLQQDGKFIRRFASVHEVPAEFLSVGAGFYRQGHAIWELRAAEDEQGGYVLTRKREERAVDLRDDKIASVTESTTKTAATTCTCYCSCASGLVIGQKVAYVVNGQMIPVVVISIGENEAQVVTDDVDDATNETGPHLMSAPLDMLLPDAFGAALSSYDTCGQDNMVDELSEANFGAANDNGEPPIDCGCSCHTETETQGEGEIPVPQLEPTSKSETPAPTLVIQRGAAHIRRNGPTMNLHKWLHATKAFKPEYMGGRVVVDPKEREAFKMISVSKADPLEDRLKGVPNPVLPHPNAKGTAWHTHNARIELETSMGNRIWVTPNELERFFAVASGQPDKDEESSMPGKPMTYDQQLIPADEITGDEQTIMRPFVGNKTVVQRRK